MISYIEPYLRRLQVEGIKNPIVIVINPGRCPNEQLTRMYRRKLWILDDGHPIFRQLFSFRVAMSGSKLEAPLRSGHTIEFRDAWEKGKPTLDFTPEETREGEALLRTLGIAEGGSYVCFGLREAAYYEDLSMFKDTRWRPDRPWQETYCWNPPLANYIPMAMRCAERGLFVLRMGKVVGEKMPGELPPEIIDYALLCRTSFGDIFLLANCKFLVSGASGLWYISAAFDRPVVLADVYDMRVRPVRASDLFIPKKLWLCSERRFMTFREVLQSGVRYLYPANRVQDGVEVVHNTPEEITAVVDEMNQRLDGTWQSDCEDEELQRRFDGLYRPEHNGYGMSGRVGAWFLRENRKLLEY